MRIINYLDERVAVPARKISARTRFDVERDKIGTFPRTAELTDDD